VCIPSQNSASWLYTGCSATLVCVGFRASMAATVVLARVACEAALKALMGRVHCREATVAESKVSFWPPGPIIFL
jgi:hypothetical protein